MWLNQFLIPVIILSITFAQELIVPNKNGKLPCEFISKFLNETLKLEKYRHVDLVVSPGSLIHSLLPVINLSHEYRDRFEFLRSLVHDESMKDYEIEKFLNAFGMYFTNYWFYDGRIVDKLNYQIHRTNFSFKAIRGRPLSELPVSFIDKEDLNPMNNQTEAVKEYVKDAYLIIVNTATFKATWKYPFFPQIHYAPSGAFLLMSGAFYIFKGRLVITKELRADWIELPFKNGPVSMYFFTSTSRGSFEKLQMTIANMNFNNLIGKKQLVDVMLPKFKIQKSINLRPILEKMGLEKIFEASTTGSMRVDKLLQTITFEISEFGAEPVDQDDLGISETLWHLLMNIYLTKPTPSELNTVRFHATGSFFYAIVHKPSGLPLFFGRYI